MNNPETTEALTTGLDAAYKLGLEHALKICADSTTLAEATVRIEALTANPPSQPTPDA